MKSSTLYLINAVVTTVSATILMLGAAVGIVDDLTAVICSFAALLSYTTYLYAPKNDERPDDDDDDDSGHNQPEIMR
jgi:hypothetical protein